MAYFGKSLTSKKIEISHDSTTSNDPDLLKRLERIEANYAKLGDILNELELKFELDDRLAEILGTEASDTKPKKPR